jgi:hypothetical protein
VSVQERTKVTRTVSGQVEVIGIVNVQETKRTVIVQETIRIVIVQETIRIVNVQETIRTEEEIAMKDGTVIVTVIEIEIEIIEAEIVAVQEIVMTDLLVNEAVEGLVVQEVIVEAQHRKEDERKSHLISAMPLPKAWLQS